VAKVQTPAPSGVSSASIRLGIGDLVLPAGAPGIRLAVALLAVPALLVLWLLLAARTGALAVARRTRGSRAALAVQLGLPPEQLRGVDAKGLRTLRDRVAIDEVTGVASRAAGTSALKREAARARRQGAELSVLFVDVDGLKAVNDGQGHGAGDRLLKDVAATLAGRLRAQDLVFRYGGDEFVCVLPGTPEAEATRVAGEIRKAAGRERAFSYGVAALEAGEDVDALLARADARQYRDKRTRRAGRPNAPSGSG
jgi:diguanylate cyclase (GGDEF)-like protein